MRSGAELLARDGQGFTALHLAVQGGYRMLTTYLLAVTPELVHVGDHHAQTALHWAAYRASG